MMIKVEVGNNMKRTTTIVDDSTTIRTVLDDNGIDYSRVMPTLNGGFIGYADLDKTFADYGITESCYLLSVVKTDNAR